MREITKPTRKPQADSSPSEQQHGTFACVNAGNVRQCYCYQCDDEIHVSVSDGVM